MSIRPKRTKKDANQPDIIRDFRDCGYAVESIADTCAFADIMVWGLHWGLQVHVWRVFEIKDTGGNLTATEQEFQDQHPGAVHTIQCVGDGLYFFGRCE